MPMSWLRACVVAFLLASGVASLQVILDPDAKLLNAFSAIPGAVWTSNFYSRNWLMLPVNQTHPENSENSQKTPSKTQCAIDLLHTVISLTKEKWAMQMVDSVGKPEAGVLDGRFTWTGNYDECLDVSVPTGNFSSGFVGQYCWLTFNPKIEAELKTAFKIGICLPNSCDSNQIMNSYEELVLLLVKIPVINKFMKNIPLTAISCVPVTVTWSTSALGCFVFLSLLASIVIVATSFDLVSKYMPKRGTEHSVVHQSNNIANENNIHPHETPTVNDSTENINSRSDDDRNSLIPTEKRRRTNAYREFLMCFSAAKNGSAILDISARSGQLDCIHGIRFLSMSWVILGHTFLFSVGQIANPKEILKLLDMPSFQGVIQSPFSVDTFFFITGFLLTYLFLKEGGASPKGVGGWIYFYAHRYIRLTPVYAITLGFWASVWSYLGSGPFWQYDRLETANCDNYWWWNLLYINNFNSLTKMCMGWSWYLSNDMQFYIISPLLLIPLKRRPIIGLTLTSLALLGSWLGTFLLSYENNYTVFLEGDHGIDGMDLTDPNSPVVRQFDMIYEKPYCRIGPFLVGMLVAYCFLVTKDHRRSIPKSIVALGWISATTCGLVLVYGLYHTNLGIVSSAFYTSLSRSAWALSLGWLIYACLSGYGGPVNSLLSLKYFFPLSRLTYCAYLIHPMIIYWYFGTLKDTMYLSLTTISMLYLSFLVLSYGFAFLVSLLFESPIVALEKQFRNMFKK